jgi:hypothetical protein
MAPYSPTVMKATGGVRDRMHKTSHISLISESGDKPMVPPAAPGAEGFIDVKRIWFLDHLFTSEFNENRYDSNVFACLSPLIAVSLRIFHMDMDMQHGHGHAAWTWLCSMDMDIDMQH